MGLASETENNYYSIITSLFNNYWKIILRIKIRIWSPSLQRVSHPGSEAVGQKVPFCIENACGFGSQSQFGVLFH